MKIIDSYDDVIVYEPETAKEIADFWAGVLRNRDSLEASVLATIEEPEEDK